MQIFFAVLQREALRFAYFKILSLQIAAYLSIIPYYFIFL